MDTKAHIPAFAKIAGVTLGTATIEELEERLGPGFPHTGGHPKGARQWFCPAQGWYINADGFNYDSRGHRVLDFVCVSVPEVLNRKKPAIRVPARTLKFMGVAALGMTHAQALASLKGKLPPPTLAKHNPRLQDGDFVWEAKGLVRINHSRCDDKTDWGAWLRFEGDRLVSIEISC